MSPGAQAVQGMHALVEFSVKHRALMESWHEQSNHLCFLSVKDEQALKAICAQAVEKGITFADFLEPDFGMTLTAAAFEATDQASELLRDTSLALREYDD
jgi:peptidyl-tRNA hydrolase